MINLEFVYTPDEDDAEEGVATICYSVTISRDDSHDKLTEHYLNFLRAIGYVVDNVRSLRDWSYVKTEEND